MIKFREQSPIQLSQQLKRSFLHRYASCFPLFNRKKITNSIYCLSIAYLCTRKRLSAALQIGREHSSILIMNYISLQVLLQIRSSDMSAIYRCRRSSTQKRRFCGLVLEVDFVIISVCWINRKTVYPSGADAPGVFKYR